MSRGGRRWWRWLPGGLLAVVLAAVAGVVVAYPAVGAVACPGCYGLERLRPGLYVEPGLADDQRRQVADAVADGTRHVEDFFGDLRSDPRFLACLTDACYGRIGGGAERGIAVLNRAVMLSPRGIDAVVVAHELTHVELHTRLSGATVPQWFHEGLAVLVSDDTRYLLPEGAADRCLAEPAGPLPESLEDWLAAAGADPRVYAQAACAVSRWTAWNDLHGAIAAGALPTTPPFRGPVPR